MVVRKQTWRIDTRGISRITVEFDYRAIVLAAHQARIAPDYAFFTGTQLFLLLEGHRSRPSVVRFDVPSGWRIASGLDDTADPMVFTAPDYDTLVDQPTLMGQFDVTRFMVEGKPHDFVGNPAGVFSAEKTRTLIGHLTKLAETQGRIFGGLPHRKFVYFYFFRPAEASATVLEHQTRTSPSGTPALRRSPTRWWRRPRTSSSRLERQADPSGADVALRLRARERDAAAVGVRGLHDLLRQPGGGRCDRRPPGQEAVSASLRTGWR